MIDIKTISSDIKNLELLAKQVVEGFITGIHKSPFHGFSVEFSEHKLYNKGESTRHIDWKLFAKTEKLYIKKYEEETNLRCHIIIDNSASMHYPIIKNQRINHLNKIGFSAVAAACLMEILKKQRDAVGLSIYSDSYEYYAPEKGSERHRKMLLNQLDHLVTSTSKASTETYQYLHEIAEKIHQRSLIFLFTDMFQTTKNEEELFDALRHLKFNKHEVILFHTYDKKTELLFNFDNSPKKFVDIETGEEINLHPDNIQKQYTELSKTHHKNLKNKCLQYKIDYIPVDINEGFDKILTTYLISRQKKHQ
ncbi:DUF58 domain-containing protein [Tenacibaculum finnmarkense]|uniref:DUF58 domain-containing protein n=1 Tax=Tenacibaculum finnmarkense genomovar finnmarkense TaxID=1458503 RepID=A0AAP1WFH7_9FLAO|nr:DUF58 domain-containing protein [Tenacibaculum finnmarkense]MBE7651957.1 DUF58 domain-containing protein [Tenacibaculum finnmarkense genomovar finnmarkense]MBE7694328.1 DUF58 domain-containing protein [Tenacibaculum finnmarkense genomovar finnmarkense]MCD8426174.1 DUF58 domain-containing protein [Tenacibaculum finnmarkense genomovar finnmarkense]MCG8729966.1 DUF58 domain-containing protein [Tenacibaculum finnmarkense]MCG8751561.1 DUF58 domain-containing protein [Tenacibaculum finnmarkense]